MPVTPDSATPYAAENRIIEPLYAEILRRNQGEKEFHQAVREVLETLGPVLAQRPEFVDARIIERICERSARTRAGCASTRR